MADRNRRFSPEPDIDRSSYAPEVVEVLILLVGFAIWAVGFVRHMP